MAPAGFQELKRGVITGRAVLLLNEEKNRRIPSLFPRHRKYREARKYPIFKSTEQNTRTGSKTKIENRPTVTRGERRGNFKGKGEGFVGTIIKDTWTIMGRGGWKREGDEEGGG